SWARFQKTTSSANRCQRRRRTGPRRVRATIIKHSNAAFSGIRALRAVAIALAFGCLSSSSPHGASPIAYRFTFPSPEHHWMQVEAAFTDLGTAPLELRMSRSSPGRYSLHEFAKNVYDVEAVGEDGRNLALTRTVPFARIGP